MEILRFGCHVVSITVEGYIWGMADRSSRYLIQGRWGAVPLITTRAFCLDLQSSDVLDACIEVWLWQQKAYMYVALIPTFPHRKPNVCSLCGLLAPKLPQQAEHSFLGEFVGG